jgi:hypothetical protein
MALLQGIADTLFNQSGHHPRHVWSKGALPTKRLKIRNRNTEQGNALALCVWSCGHERIIAFDHEMRNNIYGDSDKMLYSLTFGLTGHGAAWHFRHTIAKEKDQGLAALAPVSGISGCKP